MLDESLNALTTMQAGISANASQLDNQIERNTNDLNTLDSLISNIKEVDVTEVLLRLTNLETQIEASYSISTSLLKLKLTDYL